MEAGASNSAIADATDAGGETSPAAIETRCGVMRDGVSSDVPCTCFDSVWSQWMLS